MSDEFTNNVAKKFPHTLEKEVVERPWDVTEARIVPTLKRAGEEPKQQEELTDRIHTLYSELRSSLTIRSALEVDLKRAHQILEEVTRVKAEVEKIIEMLRTMEEYMRKRIG
jgi:hypothetical protein